MEKIGYSIRKYKKNISGQFDSHNITRLILQVISKGKLPELHPIERLLHW